jgi:hypothetical protein
VSFAGITRSAVITRSPVRIVYVAIPFEGDRGICFWRGFGESARTAKDSFLTQ